MLSSLGVRPFCVRSLRRLSGSLGVVSTRRLLTLLLVVLVSPGAHAEALERDPETDLLPTARGEVVGPHGDCLTATSVGLALRPCSGLPEQQFAVPRDGAVGPLSVEGGSGERCVSVLGEAVTLTSCDQAPSQLLFRMRDGRLAAAGGEASNRCLRGLDGQSEVFTGDCSASATRWLPRVDGRWTAVADTQTAPLATPFDAVSVEGRAIAISPLDSQRVWMAVESDHNHAVYESLDGGRTWRQLPTRRAIETAVRGGVTLIPRPGRAHDVFLIDDGNLLLSEAGGAFRAIGPETAVDDLAIDPRNPDLWVLPADGGRVVWRSVDAGKTWTSTRVATPEVPSSGRWDVAFDPFEPARLVALGSGQGTRFEDPQGAVFESLDGGATWTVLDRSTEARQLWFDPRVPGRMVASASDGTSGLLRSDDGGRTWTRLPAAPGGGLLRATADHRLVTVVGRTVFESADAGTTWIEGPRLVEGPETLSSFALSTDLPERWVLVATDADFTSRVLSGRPGTFDEAAPLARSRQAHRLAFSPAGSPDGESIIARVDRFQMLRSRDRGRTWVSIADDPTSCGGAIAKLEIGVGGLVYLYCRPEFLDFESNLSVSEDAGDTFSPQRPLAFGPFDLAASPVAADLAIVASLEGIHRSTDRGASWTRVDARATTWVDYDPAAPRRAYALAETLLRSDDSGLTWIDTGRSLDLAAVGARGTVFGLADGRTVVRSDDGGMTWTATGQLPAFGVRGVDDRAPFDHFRASTSLPQRLLARRQGETYGSTDGGVRWGTLPPATLLPYETETIAFAPEGTLWAVGGGGLWQGHFDQRMPMPLGAGRFEVDVAWRDFEGQTGRGAGVPRSDETGTLWFFEDENLELMVKVLDGRALNGHFWVFFGSSSNVAFDLRIIDRATGESVTYENAAGDFVSRGDVEALADAFPGPSIELGGGSAGLGTTLLLGDGRFRATVTLADVSGASGEALAVPLAGGAGDGSDDGGEAGAFAFFDPANLELLVKVLDGRAINGRFWVLYGALSNVGFTLRIEDLATGAVRRYENPLGTFASRGDTEAF